CAAARRSLRHSERSPTWRVAKSSADRDASLTLRWSKADSHPWSRYMADAFETILVAWLAFAFLPERPTRSQGGTDGSNPLSSTGESVSRTDPAVARRVRPRPGPLCELVQFRPAVVAPRGEARADIDIVFDLAVRLGLGNHFWHGNVLAALDHHL